MTGHCELCLSTKGTPVVRQDFAGRTSRTLPAGESLRLLTHFSSVAVLGAEADGDVDGVAICTAGSPALFLYSDTILDGLAYQVIVIGVASVPVRTRRG